MIAERWSVQGGTGAVERLFGLAIGFSSRGAVLGQLLKRGEVMMRASRKRRGLVAGLFGLTSTITTVGFDVAAVAAATIPAEYQFGVYSPPGSPDPGADEMSGLAPANQDGMEDVYWGVRDYDPDENRRFLYRFAYDAQEDAGPGGGNGLVVDAKIEITVPFLENDDWEAVATDQAGNDYIGDPGTGAGGNVGRRVFKLSAAQVRDWTSGALTPVKTWAYDPSAAGLTGNVEAMFSIDDQVYLMSRGANARVAKLDLNGTGLVKVPGAATIYPALADATGAEVSHDGYTMVVITRGTQLELKTSYVYPRQDLADLNADQKAVNLLAQFAAGTNSTGVVSALGYQSELEFEGVAFADTGAAAVDGTSYEARRRDDNAYVLMVTDVVTGSPNNNVVYRVPATGFRDGVSCAVTFSDDGVSAAGGDRVMVEWDGFDSNDPYSGSASVYVRRTIADPASGGSYYWQGNIGRNVHKLEQFVNGASVSKEARYTLFPRQNLSGGLTNQDMFIAVPCGEETMGDTLTCSAVWNASGGIDVSWNHRDISNRTYRVYRSVNSSADSWRAGGLTASNWSDTTPGSFTNIVYKVEAYTGSSLVDSAQCGTLFNPAGELNCKVTSAAGTDTVVWDRFAGTDFPGFPDADLAKVKVFRRNVNSSTWYHQGFYGINTDTLYEANYGNTFAYELEVWVNANGTQSALPNRVACN